MLQTQISCILRRCSCGLYFRSEERFSVGLYLWVQQAMFFLVAESTVLADGGQLWYTFLETDCEIDCGTVRQQGLLKCYSLAHRCCLEISLTSWPSIQNRFLFISRLFRGRNKAACLLRCLLWSIWKKKKHFDASKSSERDCKINPYELSGFIPTCVKRFDCFIWRKYIIRLFSHINNAQSTQSIMCYTVHFSFYKN